MSVNAIVHIELSAVDSKAAGKFYSDVFGWKTEAFAGSDYMTFEAEPGPGGGFNTIDHDHKAGEILVYLQVDDIEAKLKEITAHGGKTVQGRTEIPGQGHYAIFQDPSGNRLGVYSS